MVINSRAFHFLLLLSGIILIASGYQACHMAAGLKGPPPPVTDSDYITDNPDLAISAIVHGLSGEITVNGEVYDGVMPRQNLSDEEVANAVTYLLNSFDNGGGEVTPDDVNRVHQTKSSGLFKFLNSSGATSMTE